MARVLLIVAHPELEHSRASAALVRAAQQLAGDGLTVEIRDIYTLYPDYLVDAESPGGPTTTTVLDDIEQWRRWNAPSWWRGCIRSTGTACRP